MSVIFVTSSGTDIGKTFVSAEIVRQLRARGETTLAVKPVLSGFTPQTQDESDSAHLLRAMDRDVTQDTISAITPWRFEAALSPDMAAARENASIPFRALVSFCAEAGRGNHDHLLVEGVGGVLVPLDEEHTVLDWMSALTDHAAIEPVLVVGSYLGTVSHTLTAFHVLKEKQLAPRAIIVSASQDQPVPLEETCAAIARFAKDTPVIALPRLSPGDTAPDLLSWM